MVENLITNHAVHCRALCSNSFGMRKNKHLETLWRACQGVWHCEYQGAVFLPAKKMTAAVLSVQVLFTCYVSVTDIPLAILRGSFFETEYNLYFREPSTMFPVLKNWMTIMNQNFF